MLKLKLRPCTLQNKTDNDPQVKRLLHERCLCENTNTPKDLKRSFPLIVNPARKLTAGSFIQSQYLEALAASLRVSFCDEWKTGLSNVRPVELRAASCDLRDASCVTN